MASRLRHPIGHLASLLRQRLAAEDGFALILALGTMVVLTVTVTTLVYYSSTSARTTSYQGARQNAYALAEAGMASALSRLNNSATPNTQAALPTCATPAGYGTGTASTGTFTYCGTITGATSWLLSATGTIRSPTGASSVRKTLTRTVTIAGSTGGTVGAWNRIYSDATGACSLDVPSGVPIQGNIATKGDLCLTGSAVTGATSTAQVGGKLTMTPDATVNSGVAMPTTPIGAGWTNPGNLSVDDTLDTTQVIAAGSTGTTLYASGYGYRLPDNAVISGITVKVHRKASANNAIQSQSVMLMKAGVAVGSNLAAATNWTTAYADGTFGASNNLWGTTWTAADVDNANFGVSFAVKNVSAASVTASIDYIQVTVTYTLDASLGGSGAPIQEADVSGVCKWSTGANHTPCTSADHVYAGTITTPPALTKPTLDWTYWYNNAAPGPKHPCTTSTGTPPTFDNNSTYDGTMSSQEITPEANKDAPGADSGSSQTPNMSYTCIAKDAQGNRIGELSWNMVTRVLTIYGTIFFDGDAVNHDHNGYIVHYQGRATMFISGKWHNDEAVCAGGSGYATTCRSTANISNWDPTQNLLVLAIGAKNTGDDFDFHTNFSAFQGVIYATNNCKFHEDAMMSGPMICGSFNLDGGPGGNGPDMGFYAWPSLTSLLAGQSQADSSTATNFAVSVGNQSG